MVQNSKGLTLGMPQAVLFCLMLLLLPSPTWAEEKDDRFVLMGDGKIHIKCTRTGQEASVTILNPDGALNEEGFAGIDEIFGFPTQEKGEHISPRLIFMLDYFSDLVAPGKVINLESGYRSPDYNSNLRDKGGNVAKTSLHLDGMALDFNIEGVNGKELWEIIKSKNCGGIGHYGGANVHLDAGRPRFWEASTSKVRTGESDYNQKIYLSTDYDRYRSGDTIRLSFASVSDFRFGIKPSVVLVDDSEGQSAIMTAPVSNRNGADCCMMGDRKTSRFIYFTLPRNLRAGKYRVKIDFCEKPFEQMPDSTISNEIEVLGVTP